MDVRQDYFLFFIFLMKFCMILFGLTESVIIYRKQPKI